MSGTDNRDGWPFGDENSPDQPTQAIPPVGGGWPESGTPASAAGGWTSGTTQQFPTASGGGEPYGSQWGGSGQSPYDSSSYGTPSYGAAPYGSTPYAASAPSGSYSSYGQGQPPTGYGGYGQEPKKSNPIGWIIGGLVLLIGAVVGILFGTGIIGGSDPDPTPTVTTAPLTESSGPTTPGPVAGGPPGTDPLLDGYWVSCAGGDMAACDDLYWGSPVGSAYEDFSKTCGGTVAGPVYGSCESDASASAGTLVDGYGTDFTLDGYWDSCAGGDMAACDSLYWNSPVSSQYEDFGATCSDRQGWTAGGCATNTGSTTSTPSTLTSAPGTDATLDQYWNECAGGNMASCDYLYWNSPVNSEYEEFGGSCGGTQEVGYNQWCDPQSQFLYN